MEQEKVQEQTQTQPEERSFNFLDKAKSIFNKAKVSRYLGLVFVVTATIVISLWSVGWDPTRIGWEKFLANTSLLLFLGIYGLFFGENEGSSLFKRMVTGVYQTVRDAFLAVVKRLKDKKYVDSLPDYIVWRYQKDYENTCKMKMLSVRVFDPTVVDLSDEQIEELRHNPIEISETKHYSRLSDEQYNVVRAIKDGKIFVDYIDDYNFYLVEEGTDGEQQVTKVKKTDARKEKITWQQRGSRILLILIFAFILAGFFFDIGNSEIPKDKMTPEELKALKEQNIQALKDLLSRLACLIVSIASGFHTARLLNLQDVFVLRYKISYNTVFENCMDNKSFVPTDVETKAKQDFDNYKKEQEEAIKNVVTPDNPIIADAPEPSIKLLDSKDKEE